ncbi:DUF424 family protein [Candidatus Pacearchaeota archaeon]|nr:DUF424 family protein [Candidatus Pacearchaeota archaeon]
MPLIKIIKTYRNVIAICDEDLLGKRFEEGDFQLDVKESFFKGEKKEESELIKIIQRMFAEDATFNIVGEESIKIAMKIGIISEDDVQTIQGVPFALKLL